MDAKKAYRGAKAALRTAEKAKQELKERNYALADGARPSPKEAQAAQAYVDDLERSLEAAENEIACLNEALTQRRLYNQELYYDLRDAEELAEELESTLSRYRLRLFRAKMIGLGLAFGLIGHMLAQHWGEFPKLW